MWGISSLRACPTACLLYTSMGADQRAIYLDTNSLEYDLVPLDLKDNVVVIMNTNKRRELADSKYNERRAECEKAVEELQVALNIQTLGELDEWAFDEYSYLIKDENRLKRARHAVLENQRTLKAQAALQEGDLDKFGRLMNASHVSLEHDYEVTGLELDLSLIHILGNASRTMMNENYVFLLVMFCRPLLSFLT